MNVNEVPCREHNAQFPKVGPTKESPFSKIFREASSELKENSNRQEPGVNRSWKIGNKEFTHVSTVKKFFEFLYGNLSEKSYKIEHQKLLKIESGAKIGESINFLQTKASMDKLKENIADILKNVREEDLQALEKLFQDKVEIDCFKGVFDLINIFKDVEKFYNQPKEIRKSSDLQNVCNTLIKLGHFDLAIHFANRILDEYIKNRILSDISCALAKEGRFLQAIQVANEISDKVFKHSTIFDICCELVKVDQCKKALELIDATFEKNRSVNYVYQRLSYILALNDRLKDAFNMVTKISDPSLREYTLGCIAFGLAKEKHLEEAIAVIDNVSDKEGVRKHISFGLALAGLFAEAIKMINTITDGALKDQAFEELCLVFARKGFFDRATETLKSISNENIRKKTSKTIEKFKEDSIT